MQISKKSDLNAKFQSTKRIIQLLNKGNYKQIVSCQKQISSKILYLLRLQTVAVSVSKSLRTQISQSFEIITLLSGLPIDEREYHLLPYFHFITRIFSHRFCKNLLSGESTIPKILKKQESSCLDHYKAKLSSAQLKNSQPNFLNQYFKEIIENNLVFPNPQCVCCSQLFKKNQSIFILDSLIPIYYSNISKIAQNQVEIRRLINAVCQKGGVILIGAKAEGSNILPIGIQYNCMSDLIADECLISVIIKLIKPKCISLVQIVRVATDSYLKNRKYGQINIIFRISLTPVDKSIAYYMQVQSKGKPIKYELNSLIKSDDSTKPTNSTISTKYKTLNKGEYYSLIHDKYYETKRLVKKRENKICHKNIGCLTPIKMPSFEDLPSDTASSENGDKIESVEPLLKFKYKNTTLIVAPSKNGIRQVKKFLQKLLKRKEIFQDVQPFAQQFQKTTQRPVRMISHQMSTSELKSILKIEVQSGNIKRTAFLLMPVYNNIQIEVTKLTNYKRKIIEDKLSQCLKFDTYLEQLSESKQVNQYFKFQNLGESIKAYMILEELKIQGYFVKPGQKYVKKVEN